MFGERLKKLRKSSGLSQEQLADELKVSRQSISKWELGESNPDTDNLVALCDFFDVSLDYLLRNQKDVTDVTEKVIIREVQPIVNTGCLKKVLIGLVIFVLVWIVVVGLLYGLLFVNL